MRSPLLLAFSLASLITASCSSTVTLDPKADRPTGLRQLPLTVAVYHSPAFRAFERSADAYGNKHQFVFPLGAASHALFQNVYPRIFEHVVQVESRLSDGKGRPTFSALIEPTIEAFRFPVQSLKGPYWAEIIYRFTLYTPEGNTLLSWTVRGSGEGGDGSIYGEYGPVARAAEHAIEIAALEFMKSFDEVPEVKRWVLGLPTVGATAAADKQKTRPDPRGRDTVLGVYEGIVTVRVNRNTAPSAKAAEFKKDLNAAGLLAVQVSVRNDGRHRLRVRRSDIALMVADGRKLNPIPYTAIARAITARHGRLTSPPVGGRGAAITLLLFALVNAAAAADELAELRARMVAFQGTELRDAVLRPAESAEGFVFFAPGRDTDAGDLTVFVPVVDADTVTRYVVRVPLTGFRPYVLDPSAPETKGQAK